MTKLKFLVLILFFVIGCQRDIKEVRLEREQLDREIVSAKANVENYKNHLSTLQTEVDNLKTERAIKQGTALYIIELQLSQSHLTLDIGEMMKDSMNTTTFEIPVDKRMYDTLTVGQNLNNDFRMGSFLVNGSFGSWNVKVNKKYIKAYE